MTKYGICMEGNEEKFTQALRDAAFQARGAQFVYVEIGLADGATFASVVEQLITRPRDWIAYGFDIPNGWSYNQAMVEDRLNALGGLRGWSVTELWSGDFAPPWEPRSAHAIVHSGRDVLNSPLWDKEIDFAFIDGCHGYACAQADFLAVAARCRPGAFVVFHDTSVSCQGIHLQPHCNTPIDVRRALSDLGLLSNSYPGWTFEGSTDAPHGITIVRKDFDVDDE